MANKNYLNYFKIIILILLLAWLGFLLAQKINFTTADLGRHLKNGEIILNALSQPEIIKKILQSNFYSYTYPNHPFINHHWLGGVIFFIIYKIFNFTGLSLFYIFLNLISFLLIFDIARKTAGFKIAIPFSILLAFLIASREEIRPEVFSYFFSALFFWLLWHYASGSISYRWLFLLPLFEIIWVNTHIYFFLGPFLIFLFLLFEKLIPFKKKFKKLGLILILDVIAGLINPFGLKGLLMPLNIFKQYGYRVLENQSVWFLENLKIFNPNFLLLKIVSTLLVLSFILVLITNRRKFSLIYFCLGVCFGIMAWLAIRNFTLFGLFVLPVFAYNFKIGLLEKINLRPVVANWSAFILTLIIISLTVLINRQSLIYHWSNFGFGLMPNINASAEFFKKENLKGPIFNNYDIGSYLIFHLFPQEKVFVDNRPEAYPVNFFNEVYIPMQENHDVWLKQDKNYNFNVIFFSHRDLTPWAQNFLIERIQDPFWAPVFADQYVIIFLRRNEINKSIIEKYEIPKESFRIIKSL
jgi:hypothetical protein